ncbi:hypothetical protein NM688_g2357 [Phlebia brevispora]|uniref:Uncharacterized protein n=1 Tax=Phlebia brevispora TaxID=194682 RepID=A0ACC1T939_9APHY|nr:hypothetical protein NM688_g2357 [Phlebia brevispora]
MPRLVYCLGLFSLCCVAVLYYAGVDTVNTLSPQGCRMSWMSPSYVLQPNFDRSWSPLAGRYSLWLYREVGWESNELHGSPVLFIPGNAGSSQQVRSIASSATRQFYSSPYQIAEGFRTRNIKPLDFFAVEFNEDLSAFHGSTLDAQRQYTARAIDYILSLYPPDTSIMVMGHSMGGIVATSLLPHENISAIITMSTPHTLPPARFDRRIDHIYSKTLKVLSNDPTPILSMCGGATDLMVPSESCILPSHDHLFDPPYRRTVFTSALEGSWTGVGHREIVWCHQVRWRVARAALELSAAQTPYERSMILDTWLRDGHIPLPFGDRTNHSIALRDEDFSVLPADLHLSLKSPSGVHTYVLPTPSSPSSGAAKFVLYVLQGTIANTSPHNPLPLRASVYSCTPQEHCTTLKPTLLKLIPAPIPGRPFPVPNEGSDESEGVVLFEADVAVFSGSHVAVRVEADGRGWVAGGFVGVGGALNEANAIAPFVEYLSANVTPNALRQTVKYPNALSDALVVYRLVPTFIGQCSGLLNPLVQHTSHPSETHYYPLSSSSPILLHTHGAAPFISSPYNHGLNLTIYTSGEGGCVLKDLEITVDWWTTIGRWGVRYAAPTATWAVAIIAVVLFDAWGTLESSGMMPDVAASLSVFVTTRLGWLLPLSFAISFLPFPVDVWLGNEGEPVLAPLAPLMLLTATGLVCASWWLVTLLELPLTRIHRLFGFCSTPRPVTPPEAAAVPLIRRHPSEDLDTDDDPPSPPIIQAPQSLCQVHKHQHLLLLMTWLLPLAAPVLAVWVRTLYTAGLTTPFDGDHNVLRMWGGLC